MNVIYNIHKDNKKRETFRISPIAPIDRNEVSAKADPNPTYNNPKMRGEKGINLILFASGGQGILPVDPMGIIRWPSVDILITLLGKGGGRILFFSLRRDSYNPFATTAGKE